MIWYRDQMLETMTLIKGRDSLEAASWCIYRLQGRKDINAIILSRKLEERILIGLRMFVFV